MVAVLPTRLTDAAASSTASSEKRKPLAVKPTHLPSANSQTTWTTALGPAGGDGGLPAALTEVSPMICSLPDGPLVPLNSLGYNTNTREPV